MRAFADHDEIADLRVAMDAAENPRFAADATVVPNACMRPVHLGHIRDPALTVMVESCFALDISDRRA